jgi:hypothetical protein
MGSDHSTSNHGQRSYNISTAVRRHFQVWSPTKTDNGKWVKPNFSSNEIDGKTTENETLHNKCGTSTTDGLVERLNRTIKSVLAAYVEVNPTTWDDKLPFVTFAYNTAVQPSTKKSPFEVLFGKKLVIPTMADITCTRKTTDGKPWMRYLEAHLLIVKG